MLEQLHLTPATIQTLVLAVAIWIWFFLLAPARSFKVGVAVENIPVYFKTAGFKLLRNLALPALVALAWLAPLPDQLISLPESAIFSSDDLLAAPLAVGLTALLLLLFPAAIAIMRRRADQPANGWATPALTWFGWTWLGIVVLLVLGVPQSYLPPLSQVVGAPIGSNTAVGLAAAGAVFYLVWWGLPGASALRASQRGDLRAMSEIAHIRLWGLPAWIGMKISGAGRPVRKSEPTGERKFCPSCMRPIDNIEDFLSLDFDHCPHCKELIPAPFTMEQFVEYCADQAMRVRSETGRGRAAKRAGKIEEELVQHLLRGLLAYGVRSRATDIHLVNDSNQLTVRYRIDGVLQNLFNFPDELNRNLISAIKVQARLDITEQRKPQDGSFKTSVEETNLDVRVNTSPSSEGETASLRLIYRNRCLGSIDALGMSRRARATLEQTIRHPHGLILVTGPTGSGKSTTLYNSLAAISDGKRNIITLEDPIEFKIDGMTQMQVDQKKGFTFASGLRTILRQDPDVIMVGEVRDSDTAKMAVDASMTGHLVLTTLHTIDTTTAIGRLFDLGVDPHQHAEALQLIIAQRLVRLICPHCSEEYKVTREDLAALGLPGGPVKLVLRRGRGCPHCFETGYFEREGIYESLPASHTIKQLISAKAAPHAIRDEARREGMRTLLEDGMVKVILGRTSIDEVQRVTS